MMRYYTCTLNHLSVFLSVLSNLPVRFKADKKHILIPTQRCKQLAFPCQNYFKKSKYTLQYYSSNKIKSRVNSI